MKDNKYIITGNKLIAEDTYLLTLKGDTSEIDRPGLFINLKIDGCYLRRPMSIAGHRADEMTVIYKVVGKGTYKLSKMIKGDSIMALCPLGNGYDMEKMPDDVVLVGGGVGAVPIYFLAEELVKIGKHPRVVIGFNTGSEVLFDKEFETLGIKYSITTVDGSKGIKGFVTEAIIPCEYICACGPEPMLKAVYPKAPKGQYDLSARMACGFGACMGCTMVTKSGTKRVCKEGPIFFAEEIIW